MKRNLLKTLANQKRVVENPKVYIVTINPLKDDKVGKYEPKTISEVFKMFSANITETLLEKLLLPPNKYGIDSINQFYKNLNITSKSQLKPTMKMLKILKNIETSKAAATDNLSGRFLKDGAFILARQFLIHAK